MINLLINQLKLPTQNFSFTRHASIATFAKVTFPTTSNSFGPFRWPKERVSDQLVTNPYVRPEEHCSAFAKQFRQKLRAKGAGPGPGEAVSAHPILKYKGIPAYRFILLPNRMRQKPPQFANNLINSLPNTIAEIYYGLPSVGVFLNCFNWVRRKY